MHDITPQYIEQNLLRASSTAEHDVYSANLPRHGSSSPAPEPSYMQPVTSLDSQNTDGRAVMPVLPASTRSNLAQIISERSELYAELAASWGKDTSLMRARHATSHLQAEVHDLVMRVAVLQDELVKNGISVPDQEQKCSMSGDPDAEKSAHPVVAEVAPDVYTANLPARTAEEEKESDEQQVNYAAESAASEDSGEDVTNALQVCDCSSSVYPIVFAAI